MQCKTSYWSRMYRCGCQIQKRNALCLENFLFCFGSYSDPPRSVVCPIAVPRPDRVQASHPDNANTLRHFVTVRVESTPCLIWLERNIRRYDGVQYPTAKRKFYNQSTTKCLSINPKAVINNLHLNFLFPQLDDIKRLQHYQSILLSSQAPTIPLKRGRRHYLSNCNRHHPLLFDTTASCCYY
jgi:hypothetical protein